MKISLENKVVGRTIVVEASDTFMQNPDDIRVIAGTDCYKLVSTKSDIDKKREVLGLEFANEVFPEIQTKNPKISISEDWKIFDVLMIISFVDFVDEILFFFNYVSNTFEYCRCPNFNSIVTVRHLLQFEYAIMKIFQCR